MMPKSGLSRWFSEKWVDLSRPKEGGGFEPCGRPDADEGKYPKCVPASRAAKMTEEEIRSAVRRKRMAESTQDRDGQKPINVDTVKKMDVPSDPELYAKVKAEAKAKFDVYPSAYANGWLVQEYKRRGGKYKTITKGDYPGHPFRGNQWTGGIPDPNSGRVSRKKRENRDMLRQMQEKTTEGLSRITAHINKYGGVSWNPKRGEIRAAGVAVSPLKSAELKIPVDKIMEDGPSAIKRYVVTHAEKLSMPGAHLGGWIADGFLWLDVSYVIEGEGAVSRAADIGRQADQVGIFDMYTMTELIRHRSPTTGEYRYLPSTMFEGASNEDLDRLADEIGKAANPVVFVDAANLTDETIEAFCARMAGKQMRKDSPTPNTVHVDSVMGSKDKKKRKRGISYMREERVGKGDYPGHPFRGNQWVGGIYSAPDKGAGNGRAPAPKTAPRSAKDGFKPATKADLDALFKKHKIKVPPQWTDVYIANDPVKGQNGLLVRGLDAKGRIQSLYSAEHTARQAAKKWKRVKELSGDISKLDRTLARDALTDDAAAAVLIMRELGMRPGSTSNTGASQQAYGATTLKASHVHLSPTTKTVRFTFVGKGGKKISVSTRNPDVWAAVSKRMKKAKGTDRLFDTSPAEANDYIKSKTGKAYTAKDLRTHKAMTVALDMISKLGPRQRPKTAKEFRKLQLKVGDAVAAQLGNTRTMALNSYIPPMVFDSVRVD